MVFIVFRDWGALSVEKYDVGARLRMRKYRLQVDCDPNEDNHLEHICSQTNEGKAAICSIGKIYITRIIELMMIDSLCMTSLSSPSYLFSLRFS